MAAQLLIQLGGASGTEIGPPQVALAGAKADLARVPDRELAWAATDLCAVGQSLREVGSAAAGDAVIALVLELTPRLQSVLTAAKAAASDERGRATMGALGLSAEGWFQMSERAPPSGDQVPSGPAARFALEKGLERKKR